MDKSSKNKHKSSVGKEKIYKKNFTGWMKVKIFLPIG
jgi:hypothetical protein